MADYNGIIDDGVSAYGTHSKILIEGEFVTDLKSYDAQPHLDYAAQARQATDGQRWGEGKLVGHLPMAEYARFMAIRDNQERQKQIKAWLHANPKFVMFDKYLK